MLTFISLFSLLICSLTVYNDWTIGITFLPILLCVPLLRRRTWKKRKAFALTTILAFILAYGAYFVYESKFSPGPVQTQYFASPILITTGQIIADLGKQKYNFQTSQGSRYLMSKTGHTIGQSLRLVASPAQNKQLTGESVRYQGFNFPKRLKMKGYAGALFETNSVSLNTGESLGRLVDTRQNVRSTIVRRMTKPNGQSSSALSWALGMFVGDKSGFSPTQYQTLIDSGLVHLVAVSGGNIVMLVTFLTALLFFVPFYPRLVLLLAAVIGYGLLCGMDSSVFRAVIMGVLSLLALLLGRPNLTRRALGLTYIAMLTYNPYFLIYDVGFSLSFGAVLGIVLFGEFTHAKISAEDDHKPKVSKSFVYKIFEYPRINYIKPSIGATLGVFPVLIFFMDKTNLTSIGANLFVLPVVPLLMIGSLVQLIVPDFLVVYILRGLEYLGDWILWVAKITGDYGIVLSSDDLLIKYGLVGLAIVMMVGYHSGSTHPGGISKNRRSSAISRKDPPGWNGDVLDSK